MQIDPGIHCAMLPFTPGETLVVVVEMSQRSWLVGGLIPGVTRQPLKKIGADEFALIDLIERWRTQAVEASVRVSRIVVTYEAGRDGFWLARWLRQRGIEGLVLHASSVAVSRDRRRAKTDRLDTQLLLRVVLGWLRGEPGHCRMVAVPDVVAEDAKRPSRERENLIGERTRLINRMKAACARLGLRGFKPQLRAAATQLDQLRTPEGGPLPPLALAELRRDLARLGFIESQIREIERERRNRLTAAAAAPGRREAMMGALSRVVGIGVETSDMLVTEVLGRDIRDRRALARYAGLTGLPDESGSRRRERGLARAGNARVRTAMVQLAWRFLVFQKDSALVGWYRRRTADGRSRTRLTMIVALARKLLIALWRMVTTGEVPAGVRLRSLQPA